MTIPRHVILFAALVMAVSVTAASALEPRCQGNVSCYFHLEVVPVAGKPGAVLLNVTNDSDREITEILWRCDGSRTGLIYTGRVAPHSTETETTNIPTGVMMIGECRVIQFR